MMETATLSTKSSCAPYQDNVTARADLTHIK